MALTDQQKIDLKAHIDASEDLNIHPHTGEGAIAIAAILNAPAEPAVIVWKTELSVSEPMTNGFDWTEVFGLNAGRARIWEWMQSIGVINPSKPNVRDGIARAFQESPNTLAAVQPHLKRTGNRIEALFAVGTGTTEAPATMNYEGTISYIEVYHARDV